MRTRSRRGARRRSAPSRRCCRTACACGTRRAASYPAACPFREARSSCGWPATTLRCTIASADTPRPMHCSSSRSRPRWWSRARISGATASTRSGHRASRWSAARPFRAPRSASRGSRSVAAAAFERTLGDAGRDRIAQWVRGGGVLITIDAATGWLASERLGLSRLRARRDSARADSSGGAPLPADVPGAIVRVVGDTLSPLMAGVHDREFAAMANSDRAYTVPRDLRAGEAVVRYAPRDRLRLAGYLWPESPARLADSPYLWTERVGRGRVIAFAGEPNFRDLWRGLLPLFANSVLLGASF